MAFKVHFLSWLNAQELTLQLMLCEPFNDMLFLSLLNDFKLIIALRRKNILVFSALKK